MPKTKPAADPTLDLVMWDIGRAHYAYVGVAERILAREGLTDSIRPGMGLVLFALYERDGRTIKEIAARSQLAASTLSGLLARMEKDGLVRRSRDDLDARLVRVHLAPPGRALEGRCRAMVAQMNGLIVAGLGERRAAEAQRLLRRLVEVLRAEDERLAT